MSDMIYLGLTFGFFALMSAFIWLCDHLMEK
jgi:preprotein translocase subunit SecE